MAEVQSSSAEASSSSLVMRGSEAYSLGKALGAGSFGSVTLAQVVETKETVAIKQVLQDPRYKNRELDIMKLLRHPNVVELRDFYYTPVAAEQQRTGSHGEKASNLNVVMEYIPETVYRVVKGYTRQQRMLPMVLVKLYVYQICRGVAHLHALGICHRDIKPQNLLVDPKRHVLKICDFGSAKILKPGECSVSYICSRYYRAPELMLGATEYTTAIDIWSIGCVMGEIMLGRPLFPGTTSVDQLVKIIQTMGTPTRDQMSSMNPNYTEFRFPEVKPRQWTKIFPEGSGVCSEALGLLTGLLAYEPEKRLPLHDALAHEFFDELRDPSTRLPGDVAMPVLADFNHEEICNASTAVRPKLIAWKAAEARRAEADE
ncbi:unnamed protein product [Vitrella brassicaformis CCMP3155]|uniref:Protein kinase domain-containing protein n=1 Tax=Vitrella brassicaformis (strain CCMP3155) TaxID=1169540 RepID=A0A0G4EYJ7_VITBC|nr:unnamed protein product [Vitrella brassicaformis CCMP3155]|mmetsp:Transcript_27936/g.80416  ORF Transcript_27936/g.80416 Transcript_27936/m.80416 type:complete len:373 (+) Transcript_27936:203-1321(+)|eukprot:CEM04128.1 unnamed protein product [Vitrella brassicaformis CCMP3155]